MHRYLCHFSAGIWGSVGLIQQEGPTLTRILIAVAFVMSLFAVPTFASETVKLKKYDATYAKKKRRRSKRSYAGVVARIDLSAQRMYVYENGRKKYTWKVSTGRNGYRTPTGSWRIHRMHKRYFSKKYHGAPMPYSMFYYRGFAIHGTNAISRLGRPASHGCVRLHPRNAATLFSMVKRKGGRVVVSH